MDRELIEIQVEKIMTDLLDKMTLHKGAIFVLGLSSSEGIGGYIGKDSSQEIGEVIVKRLLEILSARGIHLAVQGCEHINRALVVER